MPDFVTTLQCLGSLRLAKKWLADGSISNYDDAANFHFVEHKIRTFRGMCKLLDMLAGQPRCAVIRGKWAKDVLPAKDEKVRKNLDNFVDYPRYWACLDVDKFEPKTADPVLEPERAIEEYIQSELPPEFHYRACRWQLSSSAGKPGSEHLLKAHLWFWLKTPYGSGALKAWKIAKGIDVDGALFNAVQFHFTADPLFEDGVVDPVPVRSGVIDGFEDEVDLVISESLLAQVKTHDRTGGGIDLPDPTKKRGVIGAFCRAYSIPRVLEEFEVPFEYETPGDNRRLNFLDGGGAPGGVFITPCENYLVNKHNTDPFLNRAVNAFDLVRYYRFGALDDDDAFDADPTSSTSFHRMVELAKTLPEVQTELAAEREEQAVESATAELELAVDDGESILTQLRAMTPEDVGAQWIELSMDVGPIAQDRILTHVVAILQVGRRPLQQALVQSRNARDNEIRRQNHERSLRNRLSLLYRPDISTEQARQVERLIVSNTSGLGNAHDYFYFGGLPSYLALEALPKSHHPDDDDRPPPVIPTVKAMSNSIMISRAEEVVAFLPGGGDGPPALLGIPGRIVDALMKMEKPEAPFASGIVTHPIVLRSGRILSQPGLDEASALLGWLNKVDGCRPYSFDEAQGALARVRETYLGGFEFKSPLDEAIALAALFTAVERRAVDQAPAFMITADLQGTGKTALARRIHVYLTGRDMPTVVYPRQSDEANKLLFALLLANPAMVCFDNIKDNTTFESETLNQILTNPFFSQRILAESRTAKVPTDVFFVLTGNKMSLGPDELSRYLEVKLTAHTPRPDQRTFAVDDVLTHALEHREDVLRDVVGIISGFLDAHRKKGLIRTRFTAWDRMVRQPLMWVRCPDVAGGFDRNHELSDDTRVESAVLSHLFDVFGTERFRVSDVMVKCDKFHDEDEGLHHALEDMFEHRRYQAAPGLHSRGVGRILKGLSGKQKEGPGGVVMSLDMRTKDGYAVFQVVTEFDEL